MIKATAHEIAAEPELYNRVWKIGRYTMECYGYSKTGSTVIFADVEPTDDHKLRLIRRYVDPNKILESVEK